MPKNRSLLLPLFVTVTDWAALVVPTAWVAKARLDGATVTVVDLQKQEVIKSMDTLKDAGFNPNCLVLLPQWYNAAGH